MDVTAVTPEEAAREAQRRLAFLSEASAVLASSLDYDTTVDSVARLAVPRLADWCMIDMLDAGRQSFARLAVAHSDPTRVRWGFELQRYPPKPGTPGGFWAAVRTGRTQLHPDVTVEHLQAVAHDAEHLRILRGVGARSYAIVPLVARGDTLGAITFVHAESGRRFGPGDLGLLEELARLTALAVDNARLYRDARAAIQCREESLATRSRQQARLAELGLKALAGGELSALLDEVAALVADTLGVEFTAILELLPARDALLLRAGRGWRGGLVGNATISAGPDTEVGFALVSGEPAVTAALDQETRFVGSALVREHGAVSGASVVIQRPGRPVGVVSAHSARRRTFGPDDLYFLEGVAQVLAAAMERHRSEQHRRVQHAVASVLAGAAGLEQAVSGVVAAICTTLDFDLGVAWVPDSQQQVLRCGHVWRRPEVEAAPFIALTRQMTFPSDQGIVGRVWLTGEPTWLEDLGGEPAFLRSAAAAAAGMRGAVWFPALAGSAVLGVMEFLSQHPRTADPDLLQTMVTIGRQMGQFIERKQAQARLRQSEERLRMALDAGRAGTWEWHIATGAVDWSATLEAIHGYDPGTFGRTFAAYVQHTHPDDRELVTRHLNRVLQTGTDHDLEYRIVWPDGSVRWVHGKGVLLRNAAGEPERMIGVCIDITQRKRIDEEIRQLNAELERRVAERTRDLEVAVQELEAFSYSVSHDLRSPLRIIDGFSQALLEDCSRQLDPLGQDYLQRLRSAAQRMSTLIDVLLKLSRVSRSEMRRELVNLSDLARAIAADLVRSQPRRSVAWEIQDGIRVYGDESLLRVALQNLLDNAWKFTLRRAGARIQFGMSSEGGEPIYFVRDNGAGFDMAYAGKLFGAFQRLHSESEFEGVGIGLATVQRIVRRHGGRIWAEAAIDRGATFCFTLTAEEDQPHVDTTQYPAGGG